MDRSQLHILSERHRKELFALLSEQELHDFRIVVEQIYVPNSYYFKPFSQRDFKARALLDYQYMIDSLREIGIAIYEYDDDGVAVFHVNALFNSIILEWMAK